MRILQLAQFYPPVIGGEERHVYNLSGALARLGHDVHVATLQVDGDPAAPGAPAADQPGVSVHRLDSVGRRVPSLYAASDRPLALPLPDPVVTRALHRVVAEVRPDVVHAHNWIINSYLPLPVARRLPLVYSLHDYSHVCATKRFMHDELPCSGPELGKCGPCADGHYGRGKGRVISATVRGGRPARNRAVDVFTPVSTAVARGNLLDEQDLPWEHVPNFVPDELVAAEQRPRDPELPAGPYFFFAGDLSREKGVATLVEAYERLPEATRPALHLVGRPDDGLPERLPAGVTVGTFWAHDRVVNGFQHALAAALPSEWPDPCPTTVLEAMALGAPLVTTHLGGIADMVRPEESALVVPPGDPTALAAALGRVAADDDLRSRLRLGAAADVQRFLRDSVARQLVGIYTRCLTDRGTAAPA